MKCRSCGTEIAANALICYRCGTAAAEPRIPPPVAAGRNGRGWIVPVVLAVAAALAAAAWAWF